MAEKTEPIPLAARTQSVMKGQLTMKTVLITGASTGIGRATAEYLAARDWRVFAGVRKEADGEVLRVANPTILPIILDVTKPEQIERSVREVDLALGGATLSGLVNNAGVADYGPLALQDLDVFKWHYEVNLFGVLAVTQAMLPLLGMDTNRTGAPGRIVNISSVGGKISAPFLGAYASTKHAIEAITDSLRRELVVYGIDAIVVGPGAIKTPIWEKAENDVSTGPYAGSRWEQPLKNAVDLMTDAGDDGLPAESVAKVIETALSSKKPKARYAPVPNKFTNFTIASRLPKRTLDKIFWKRFGLK